MITSLARRVASSDMSLGNDLKIKSVDLTVSPLPIQVHSQGIIQLLDNDEKDRESERSRVSQEIPIHYHYLTFDTELPSPTTTTSSNRNAPPPPEPDLKQYESPFKWSKTRKTLTTWLLCLVAAASAMSAGIYPAGTAQMQEYWHISEVVNFLGITTFTTGFSVAPMILAPFSEINGRRPVFLVTGIMFVVCTLCCAVTRSFPGMLVARFFTGVGASTFSTMVGGVISDMYHTDDRNTAMCLFAGASLFGTGFGPIVGGAIAQHISWRWMFYVMTIFVGVLVAAVMIFFNETRGSVLLSRKAKALNKWYEEREKSGFVGFEMPISEDGILTTQSQRVRWKVKSDEERESWHKMIGISLYRPFHLLITEPVVFFFSLWISFSWSVLYLTFGAIPLVFRTNHDFNVQQTGAVFTAMCVGAILSNILSIYQEKVATRYGKCSRTAEGRLYFACFESALMPIGLFWFGWASFRAIHWIVPTMGVACATMGIFSIFLAVFNYLTDTYHCYASSALAAQSFCRNMLAGAIPLVTSQMFRRMTFAGASSFLGGVLLISNNTKGAILTLVPWVLVFYGPKIRARSRFASEIVH